MGALDITLAIVAIILTLIAGGFAASSASRAPHGHARNMAIGAAVLGLGGAILLIIGVITIGIFTEGAIFTVGGAGIFLMVFALLMLLGTGIMAAISASEQGSSSRGYGHAVTAALLSLLTIGLLFIGFLVVLYIRHRRNTKTTTTATATAGTKSTAIEMQPISRSAMQQLMTGAIPIE